MKVFLVMLISMTLPVGLSAQAVGGKLVDENGRPLAYANVVVLSLPDSAFVTGTVSNEDGAFRLDCPEGADLLRVSSVGYVSLYKRCGEGDVGTLRMRPDARMLDESTSATF